MKKKIVFMVINMNIGGTEKALLNMINEMPKGLYEITILMLEKYGGFLDAIPKEIKVEYLEDYAAYKQLLNRPVKTTAVELIKQGKIIKSIMLGCVYTLSKISHSKILYYHYVLKNLPEYKKKYDVAIAFAGPMDFISYFVAKKIKAEKKIQWIHFDVTKIGFNRSFASKVYCMFDKVFVVSEEAKGKLLNLIPAIETRTEVLFNVISPKLIDKQASEGRGFLDENTHLRLLTVGRLTSEKGQDLAIRVLRKLRDQNYKVKWYCLGEGNARSDYEKLISKNNLKKDFILLGKDTNPYPYINQCDIYIQPSRYEGYCITLMEARCLNKPIITTNVNGAKEQIKNGETGIIVNFDEDELFNAIIKLLKDKELRGQFAKNLSVERYDPGNEIAKLYKMIN